MSARAKNGPAALQAWAKQVTRGYRGVSITNMTTCWRNGLAFCALIHRFHPELLDYDSLDGEDIIGNCSLAFEIAESKLEIPALLDPQDMKMLEVPDKLSIMTYVAQFYNVLKNAEKRSNVRDDEDSPPISLVDGVVKKVEIGSKRISSDEILEATRGVGPKRPVLLQSRAVCSVCTNPVFLSERVIVAKKLYHRSCFRCSNCDCVLNPNTVDVGPDGKVYCIEKDCHRKLLLMQTGSRTKIQAEDSVKVNPIRPSENTETKQGPAEVGGPVDKPGHPAEGLCSASDEICDAANATQVKIEIVPPPATSSDTVEPTDVISPMKETLSAHGDDEDKLHIEDIENPSIDSDKRSVSFSEIVKVAKIESESVADLPCSAEKSEVIGSDTTETSQIPRNHSDVPEVAPEKHNPLESIEESKEISDAPKADTVTETSEPLAKVTEETSSETNESPKARHKNVFEFLRDNLETMGAASPATTVDVPTSEATNSAESSSDSKLNEDCIHGNESGVGDSLASDSKSDVQSADSSDCEPKERVPSECGEAGEIGAINEPLDEPTDTQVSENSKLFNEPSDTSDKIQPADFEASNKNEPSDVEVPNKNEASVDDSDAPAKPIIVPRKARSKSPTIPEEKSPVPLPRKRTSANELYKAKDYYPSELNPFESEDSLVMEEPSDIVVVVKKTSSRERIAPLNPFDEDEDEEEQQPTPQQLPMYTAPPKSPVNSIRSTGSGSGSVSGRPRKSRRAPLPPTMAQSSTSSPTIPVSPSKRPAPPPPRQIPPRILSPNATPEKRVIPASPKLSKGLKEKTNKATAAQQQHRKKRRAPPPKRFVAPLPEEAIKTELADLTIQERELERQGITLEANIRKLMDKEEDDDNDLSEQVDEMVVQLWNVVNQKNDIVRRQTELDYLRRSHRLEQMQADVEFQLRMLIETPVEQRGEDQEESEQQLLQQLLKIVDERNEVVDWLDFHRQLDREEDLCVSQSLSSFSSVNSRSTTPTPTQIVLPIASETGHEETNGSLNGSLKKSPKDEKGSKKDKFKLGGIFSTLKRKKHKSKKHQEEEKDKDESLKA